MALSLLAIARPAAASSDQLPGFDLERLETNVGRGSVLMGNGELVVPGGLSVNLLTHYQRLPLILSDGEKDLRIVSDRVTFLMGASYGLTHWLEVGAQVPAVLWQQGADPSSAGLARLNAQGLGTPVVQARLGLLSRAQRKPVDLSADLALGLPFGTQQALSGDAGPRFQARMNMGMSAGWLRPTFEAGVLFRPPVLLATAAGQPKPSTNAEVHLAAGLSTAGKGQRGELALRATVGSQVSVDLLGGVRFPMLSGLDAFVMGGPGVGSALGTPQFRVLAGVTFRSEPPPRISFIDETEDRELQLALAEPSVLKEDNPVKPTSTWQLNALAREDTADEERTALGPQPYQPGPRDKLMLRGELHFAQGSAELPAVVPLLDQAAQRLFERARSGVVYVEGHADREGSQWSDMTVSVQRAQAVRRYLISQGIPSDHVKIRPFGADRPVSPRPATEQEHQLNRRVEVLVIDSQVISADTPP